MVLGLEEWAQFSASTNNCTAWYSICALLFIFYFFWLLSGLRESSLTLVFLLSGSLDSEAGIYALCYDLTGSRLISCEADKTIKMWKEDENATPETHPLSYKPPKDIRRF